MIDDPVMQALFYPARKGFMTLPPEREILIANGTASPSLHDAETGRLYVWQWWEGEAHALTERKIRVSPNCPDGPFPAVLVRMPRQREEGFALVARSWDALEHGGILVAAAANDSGGGRLEKDFLPWCPALQSTAKHRCRIVWAVKDGTAAPPDSWHDGEHLRVHKDTGLWTQPGLFSWDAIDPATTLLLDHLPSGEIGSFADPGCGYGAIAMELLKRNPECRSLTCIDADARAVEACRRNIGDSFPGKTVDCLWHDLTRSTAGVKADWVIMNPPFHRDRVESVALGLAFISRAREMLKPGGSILMVANAHLPYESHLSGLFKKIEKCHEGKGFKIYRASSPF